MKLEMGLSFCFFLYLLYFKKGRRGVYLYCDYSRLLVYLVYEIKFFCNLSKVCG